MKHLMHPFLMNSSIVCCKTCRDGIQYLLPTSCTLLCMVWPTRATQPECMHIISSFAGTSAMHETELTGAPAGVAASDGWERSATGR
jgi:hypothetical protein